MQSQKLLVLLPLVAFGLVSRVSAATDTWTGAGGNSTWSNSSNWSGSVAPVSGDSLVFDGSNTSSKNDNASFSIATITFAATAGAFNITQASGAALTITSGITDLNTTNVETLNATFALSNGAKVFNVSTGGNLAYAKFTGSATAGISLTGGGTVTTAGAAGNTYGGTTAIGAGTFLANNTPSSTGTGSVTIANSATLGGSGLINPTTTSKITFASGGIFAPGTSGSTNALTISAASNTNTTGMLLVSGAAFNFNLNSGNTASSLNLTNVIANEITGLSGNTFNFTDLASGSLATGRYTLINTDSSSIDAFASSISGTGVVSGFTLNGLSAYTSAGDTAQLEVNQLAGTSDYALQLDIVAAPEPNCSTLLLAGVVLMVVVVRSRTSRKLTL